MKKKKNNGGRRKSSSAKQRDGVPSFSSPRAGTAPSSTLRKRSKPEQELLDALKKRGYRDFEPEYMPVTSRRWRVDFAWVLRKVALEIEGGIFMRGRHVRPSGFINDCEKYNALTLNGWRVYRVPVVKGWQDAAFAFIEAEKLT